MDLIEHLMNHGGIVRLSVLRRRRIDTSELPPGVRRYRGVVYLTDVVPPAHAHAEAHNAVVTCVSAASEHGLPVLGRGDDGRTHLAVPHNRPTRSSRASTGAVTIHRERNRILTDPRRPWLADVPTTLTRAITCLPLYEAVAMLDAAWFSGLWQPDDVVIPLRGPTSSLMRQAVARSRRRARSILETFARLILEDAGIEVVEGVFIQGVGEVDMIVFGRLVLETDGWRFHSTPGQRALDLARDRRLVAAGYVVLRFDYHTVMDDPQHFVAEVLAAREHALSLPAPHEPGSHGYPAGRWN